MIAFLKFFSASSSLPRSFNVLPRLRYAIAKSGLISIAFLIFSASSSLPRSFNIKPKLK